MRSSETINAILTFLTPVMFIVSIFLQQHAIKQAADKAEKMLHDAALRAAELLKEIHNG